VANEAFSFLLAAKPKMTVGSPDIEIRLFAAQCEPFERISFGVSFDHKNFPVFFEQRVGILAQFVLIIVTRNTRPI
jgi:hypothetical protein